MKYLRNPASGEVKYASALEAKRLRRYGWQFVHRVDWVEYQRSLVQAAMIKTMPQAVKAFGRLQ